MIRVFNAEQREDDNITHMIYILVQSDSICTINGGHGDGLRQGSCNVGLLCYKDGSCREPGRFVWD